MALCTLNKMEARLLTVTHVMISLNIYTKTGKCMLTPRVCEEDRDMINRAAHLLGMTQSVFARTVLVSAARKVIEECNGQYSERTSDA